MIKQVEQLDKARTFWPEMLESLPMLDEHKQGLKAHWRKLHSDFAIQLI